MASISSLPLELLLLIPRYLHTIEDFANLSSTSRRLRSIDIHTSPNTILYLAAKSSRVFFRPDPHFLIAATVRQISDWALLSQDNTQVLRHAIRGGVYSLLGLCVDKAGLTIEDIRRLHASRFSLINPVSDLIDRCAGAQWYQTPNFWNGGVSNPCTISIDPARSLFQIVIYGELFASTMRACLESESGLPRLDHEVRMDFIKYCIPDCMCQSYHGSVDYRGLTVLPVGPYAASPQGPEPQADSRFPQPESVSSTPRPRNELMPEKDCDQVGLDYLLSCRTWSEAWQQVRHPIGPDFADEWRQQLWSAVPQVQGLEGLEMLRPGGLEKWRPRLAAMREAIATLRDKDMPSRLLYSSWRKEIPDSPVLLAELGVTMLGLYGIT
ncbi:MAG: hypothetical protein Q9183_006021 [Haloplaca sp. 2 TL-2023]